MRPYAHVLLNMLRSRLTTTSLILVTKSLTLTNMHLTFLEISFHTETMSSLRTRTLLLSGQLPSTLISLRLTGLPNITKKLLTMIAESCRKLERLDLVVCDGLELGCCSSCLESTASQIVHSPIGNGFGNCVSGIGVLRWTSERPSVLAPAFLGYLPIAPHGLR